MHIQSHERRIEKLVGGFEYMKKLNGFRKMMAMMLTLAMVSGMISAFADEPITIINESITISGNVDKDLHVVVDDDAEDESEETIYDLSAKKKDSPTPKKYKKSKLLRSLEILCGILFAITLILLIWDIYLHSL